MANNPATWSVIDIATADAISRLLDERDISNRQIDRMTNGEIGYSRIRNIRSKERAPMRIGEFFEICDICGVDPFEMLRSIMTAAAGQQSTLDDAAADGERTPQWYADHLDEFTTAAMRGDTDAEQQAYEDLP